MLSHPSKELYAMIKEYNSKLLEYDNMFEGWLRQCEEFAEEAGVPLADWVKRKPSFSFSK